jgi:peptidyl-prolyl cis-trans isomerase C
MYAFLRAAAAVALIAVSGAVAAQTAPKPADDAVVARVNGEEIRRSALEAALESLPPQYRAMPPDQLYPVMVKQLIDQKLMSQAARKANLQNDPEVKTRMAQMEDRVLQQVLVNRAVTAEVTDAKVRARYDQVSKETPAHDEVRARHILVETQDQAKSVMGELAKGADFAEVARKRSKGPNAASGGDLGYFTREDMPKEFADAAFALKPGETTKEPIKSPIGWHVIKVEDKRKAGPPSYDDTKEEISQQLAQEAAQKFVASLRDGAKIESFDLEGRPQADAPPPAMRRVQ